MPADWIHAARQIADAIREQRHDQSLRLTLADLLARSGADAEPNEYRTRSYWAQCMSQSVSGDLSNAGPDFDSEAIRDPAWMPEPNS